MRLVINHSKLASLIGLLLLAGCTVGGLKKHYVMAEKLWGDKNYEAAVSEFSAVVAQDPDGELGLQALFRAAMTESIFLARYPEALVKFKSYVERAPTDTPGIWTAQKAIGDILFTDLRRYKESTRHYEFLTESYPKKEETPEFLYRIGKGHFYLWNFEDSIEAFRSLIRQYPKSSWAEKAQYEIGLVLLTAGGQTDPEKHWFGAAAVKEAAKEFKKFLKDSPQSVWAVEAQFGLASCAEELGHLEEAYEAYKAIESTYPSPNVVKIKLLRIQERLSQKDRSGKKADGV